MLSMGKILAYSGIMQGQEVSWMPSYGPEMRGGTANATVILSDFPINSPILHEYDSAILLNQQSLDKFEASVKPGGILLYEPNGITHHPTRNDISIYQVAAAEEAARMQSLISLNMIALGAFLKIRPIVKMENVLKGLKKSLPVRHHHLIPVNQKAINRGMEIVRGIQKV